MNGFIKSGIALAFVLCAAGKADAHAHLLGSVPAAGATVTAAPGLLSLDFSEGVQLGFTGIALRGPDGAVVSTGQARLAPSNDKELRVSLPRMLRRGQYTLEWHALSDDGHTTRGSYGFRVAN